MLILALHRVFRLLLLHLLHPSLLLDTQYVVTEPLSVHPFLQALLFFHPLLVGRGGMHTGLCHLLEESLLLLLFQGLLLVFLLQEVQHLPLYLLVLLSLRLYLVLLQEHL